MVEHVWSVLCANAVVDRETNNISLLNLIEQINIKGVLPESGKTAIVPFEMSLVSLWTRESGEVPCGGLAKIETLLGEEQLATPQEVKIDLMKYSRFRSIVKIPGLPFKGAGIYAFRMSLKNDIAADDGWKVVARVPMQIIHEPIDKEPGKSNPVV